MEKLMKYFYLHKVNRKKTIVTAESKAFSAAGSAKVSKPSTVTFDELNAL